MANTLAYYIMASILDLKSFIVQAGGGNVSENIDRLKLRTNKLQCFFLTSF
jgi:hypothetical protein